eukprot:TRINITY_DN961_c0_g1_i1.p1 TRINITY_DN961_c0_g1~~TRINITY_DN961_c0_g1_i1.p1  ORF type:complete len:198 (-),score=21.02 TRINITY_DN961_c0_g1_i1:434-1027(-)
MASVRTLALLGLVCVALCFASAHTVSAAAPPTKAQLKVELQYMANNITKTYPQYAKYAKQINKYIGLALNSKYNLTALRDATILIPSNTEAEALSKKVPANSANIPKIYNITAYHIIAKKYTIPQLRAMKARLPLPTQLTKQPIVKMSPANAKSVQFGKPASVAATWTTVQIFRMYAGPYFIAHGVDKIVIPPNTKV